MEKSDEYRAAEKAVIKAMQELIALQERVLASKRALIPLLEKLVKIKRRDRCKSQLKS